MPEELSSPYTFAFKYGLPPLVGLFAVAFTIAMLVAPQQLLGAGDVPVPVWAAWIIALMPVVVMIWTFQFVRRLVRLASDPKKLTIWTARTRVSVPLTEVELVRNRPGSWGAVIDITFRRPIQFGKTVSILPNSPDVVEHLEELIRLDH